MNEGILSVIGNTPLVRLNRVFHDCHFKAYAKLEALNPGGSIKDRAALSILRQALATGELQPWSVVVESSSGNMGIGLAQVCSYLDLRFICVIDPKTTSQNVDILKVYGAEVDLVAKPDPITGDYLQARINRVRELLETIPDSYCPSQYTNVYNSFAHHQTMREIVEALDGEVDYLFCTTSTCGTLRGCAEYVQEHGLRTKICAVDAVGSVIFGGERLPRLIPGHGAAVVPELFHDGLADECVHVSDIDCVVGCRRLVREEAILAGGSSGGVLMAIEYARAKIPLDANCVAIFPDRGDRYLNTIYSDTWVRTNLGDIAEYWENFTGTAKCEMVTY